MLCIQKLQARAKSLTLLKYASRLPRLILIFLSNLPGLALKFILLFGLKLLSLLTFPAEAPKIDLAGIE